MGETATAGVLKEQFANAFQILASAIPLFSDEEWRTGRSPFDGPARAVAHVLQCGEFYTQRDKEAFANLGTQVWEMTTVDLPDQQAMSDYLECVREMTMAWIDEIDQRGFDQPSGEEGATGLGQIVYALRHFQHHAGEVCCWQKQFDHPQNQWI